MTAAGACRYNGASIVNATAIALRPSFLAALLLAGCGVLHEEHLPAPPPVPAAVAPAQAPLVEPALKIVIRTPPRIAIALGGGAARGFSHVGVIKALEAQGIVPDIVVGTSAGSVVGSLYAGGYSGVDLQRLAIRMDEATISDWSLPDRGLFKGEALQNFINRSLQNRPIDKLAKPFAVVATDVQSGEMVVFRRGDRGWRCAPQAACRAGSNRCRSTAVSTWTAAS